MTSAGGGNREDRTPSHAHGTCAARLASTLAGALAGVVAAMALLATDAPLRELVLHADGGRMGFCLMVGGFVLTFCLGRDGPCHHDDRPERGTEIPAQTVISAPLRSSDGRHRAARDGATASGVGQCRRVLAGEGVGAHPCRDRAGVEQIDPNRGGRDLLRVGQHQMLHAGFGRTHRTPIGPGSRALLSVTKTARPTGRGAAARRWCGSGARWRTG